VWCVCVICVCVFVFVCMYAFVRRTGMVYWYGEITYNHLHGAA